jgi:RNA polymerase sigma factor (sigma-70 family)
MSQPVLDEVLRYLGKCCSAPCADLGDAQLLERFLTRREETAFTLLVQRHGPMVLSVCQRVLGNAASAEDAFQATFLVLVQRAASIRNQHSLASWLYGVAQRVAAKARDQATARLQRERRAGQMLRKEPLDELTWHELRTVLDEEIAQLPEKNRTPLLLCYFQGKTHEQAAAELGWPTRSLTSRLARGREMLRRQLLRRGISLSAGALATALCDKTTGAPLGAVLTINTVKAALGASTGRAAASGGNISANALALAQQVASGGSAMRTKLMLPMVITGLAVVGVGLAGYGSMDQRPAAGQEPRPLAVAQVDAPGQNTKPMPQFVDVLGDPLPAGALARLGTPRPGLGPDARMALAPDGKTAVTVCMASVRGLQFWDVATGKLLRRLEGSGQSVCYSPDGKLVAASFDDLNNDRRVCLWDAASGKRLAQLQLAAGHYMCSVAFSPDSTILAVGGSQTVANAPNSPCKSTVALWRWDGTSLKPFWQATTDGEAPYRGIKALAFAPDGKTLATGCHGNNTINLWNVASGKEIRQFKASGPGVGALSFSPTGHALASGSEDGAVELWDPASGTRHWQRLQVGEVQALAFAPDGKTLAVGGGHCMSLTPARNGNRPFLVLLDATAGNEARRLLSRDSVGSVAFSRDGKVLAAALSVDNTLRFWDGITGQELPWGEGHYCHVFAVAVAEDGQLAATAGDHGQIIVWDLAKAKPQRHLEGHDSSVFATRFLPAGKLLASASYDQTVRLWDLATGNEALRLDAKSKAGYLNSFAVSPDGKLAAASNHHGGNVYVWNLATGQRLHTLDHGERGVSCLAFSPDGQILAAGEFASREGKNRIILWNAWPGTKLREFRGDDHGVVSVAFAPDGRMLAATGSYSEPLAFWEVASGKKLFGLPCAPNGLVAFSPDGKTMAWASRQESICLWEIASKQVRHKFAGRAETLAFSPDGRTLVSGSLGEATALVWDVTGLRLQGQAPAGLSAEQLGMLWKALASLNAEQAGRAIWSLTTDPKKTIPFLLERMHALSAVDARRIAQWIADLDSQSYKVRAEAEKQLLTLGKRAEPALRETLAGPVSLEVGRRITKVLQTLEVADPWLRSMEVLEHIGSVEARQALEQFARDIPNDLYRQEAQAAVLRLAKRAQGRA